MFDAYRLPAGIAPDRLASFQAGDLPCRYPRPDADLLDRVAAALAAAGEALRRRPVAEIVDAIDGAAARLADGHDPIRKRAEELVSRASGYSTAMTALVLDRMAADWRADALLGLLHSELDDPAVLDRFVPAGHGRMVRALGPRLSLHIFAGNVPGVGVTSLVRSLLVKSPALAKMASGQPVLPVLFAEALASVDPAIGDALAVTYWPGGSVEAEASAMAAADVVVVYGGGDAVESLRRRAPGDTRVVVHGPRFSVGLITAPALREAPDAVAARVARAVATFDQQGCVSPHAVWVEDPDGSHAETFAVALAEALERLEDELPRGRVTPGAASAIQQERGAAEIRGHAGGAVRVLAGRGTSWTVVLEPARAFRPSCLNRFIHVHPVSSLDEAIEILRPVAGHLQSVAIEPLTHSDPHLVDALVRVGATRITDFQRLPWPPPQWHHDGQGPLTELLSWVDLER